MISNTNTTKNENWIEALGIKRAKISVLIIGNNPIEMTSFFNTLIGIRSKNYLTDVCFDVKDCFERMSKEKPEVILVDDNLPLGDIQKMVRVLRQNTKTRNIKIIVLKSSNWNYTVIDNVDDYILKDTIQGEVIDNIIAKNLNRLEHHLV